MKPSGGLHYPLITEENQEIEDHKLAKEYIANYYEDLYTVRKGKPENENWTTLITNKVKELIREAEIETPMSPITNNDLEQAIRQLKPRKATGPDNIPNELFLNADTKTKEIYKGIINQSIATNKIPKNWKRGTIKRIYKGKGVKGKCSNERGITISSNFGKLFERIINRKMIDQIRITESQAGGRKKEATTDHIMRLKDTVCDIRTKYKNAFIAFLDITKAYDKAWLDAILYVFLKKKLTSKRGKS